jgi:hypothetical protein|uniref:Uncharacterized protein n=1 Tax=viral metagenome TaxID=1070528 RepID=A0A6C0BGU3_9ZZZZ
MFFDKINPLAFFLAFAVGLFLCYITHPAPEVVVKFPSPYNAGNVTYKDKANTCFKFKADKVECPINKELIKPQPILENYEQNEKDMNQQLDFMSRPASAIHEN